MNTLKYLFIFLLIVLLCACSNQVNKKEAVIDPANELNKQQTNSLTKVAESSTENISELPLGYSFSMSEVEVAKHTDNLVEKKILTRLSKDNVLYPYKTNKGLKIEFNLEFWFHENRLYYLKLDIPWDFCKDTIFNSINEDLISKLDLTHKRISYYELFEEGDVKIVFDQWIKGNQIISYKMFYPTIRGANINYFNAPINKIASENEHQKMKDESNARIRMKDMGIENSTYDGSVSKVEAYLKSNLKDDKSYESVEWSNVTPTDNGYMVRHKYRAKNSFGAYELVNQVFYLDNNGAVIGVSDYK